MGPADKPGQDVENFGNNISEMDRWISVTGSASIELSTLVSTALIDCDILDFQLKATGLRGLVYIKSKSLSVDEIIRNLRTKLLSL